MSNLQKQASEQNGKAERTSDSPAVQGEVGQCPERRQLLLQGHDAQSDVAGGQQQQHDPVAERGETGGRKSCALTMRLKCKHIMNTKEKKTKRNTMDRLARLCLTGIMKNLFH